MDSLLGIHGDETNLIRVVDRVDDVLEDAGRLVPRASIERIVDADQSARLLSEPSDECIARRRQGGIPPGFLTDDMHHDTL